MQSYVKPTSDQVDAAVPLLSSPQHEAYFFDHLENPLWITPLAERNIFKYPPKAQHVEGGGIRFPPWPSSRYLVRMASLAPTEVAKILSEIETDNASVIGNLLKAALAMPADVATTLVPSVCRAAKEGTLWLLPKDASRLCVRLAEEGQIDSAMMLAIALFTPKLGQDAEKPGGWDEYWYKEGLKAVVPVLAKANAQEFLAKLCDWLNASINAKGHVYGGSDSSHSFIWRPAIEEHEQNRDYDFAGSMVGIVRDGFEQAIRGGSLSLAEALQIIKKYSCRIFVRLRIHLINEVAEQNPDLARQTMMKRALFDDHEYKHEYAMLMGRHLNLLSNEERKHWFRWIDAGPDMSDYDEAIKANLHPDVTDEGRRQQIDGWKFNRLHWVREHLDGARRAFYEKMLDTHGEPELADLNFRVGSGRWGNESPMTVEQLAKMPFVQVVERVTSWRPEQSSFIGPNVEGLESTFRQYVATNVDEFSKKAKELVGKPANFVRGFIGQMSEAVKAGQQLDLLAVLDLCRWVVTRPVDERTTPAREREGLVDKDWQWTRDTISEFVENVCRATNGGKPRFPLERVRQSLWELLKPLSQGPANSYVVHDISEDDPRVCDFLDLGINSPRGKAVEAAFEYARWVANHVKKTDGKLEIVPGGFDTMPEVREILAWQITGDNRTFEVMSIIGSRIGLIYWIDKKWLEENANHIFDLTGIERTPLSAAGWAAWNAFLVWVKPHIEFYRLFGSQYVYAVDQAINVKLIDRARDQPMHRLGEHLMIFYDRGALNLEDNDGLLYRFIKTMNPDIRRHAIGFVGEYLQSDEKVPTDVLERFKKLWDHYWAGPGKNDVQEKPDAYLFGTWFASGQFPEPWALDRLEQFVAISPTPEPDFAIPEQLAKIVSVDPTKTVRILDRMVRGDREGWRIDSWKEPARVILEAAMKAEDEEAHSIASKLIDHLGRCGYTEFGDLLESS